MHIALAPVLAKTRDALAKVWAKPWVRKVAALVAGSLLAASCELWPAWSHLLCTRLAPMIEMLLAGGI